MLQKRVKNNSNTCKITNGKNNESKDKKRKKRFLRETLQLGYDEVAVHHIWMDITLEIIGTRC